MYSGQYKPRIDSAEARALREALLPLIDFLPSASDRSMATDICTKSVTLGMTSAQAHWVRKFVERGQRFAASGRKGTDATASIDADIWASADTPPAAPSAPAPTEVIEIGADDLQSALKQIVDPALSAIAQDVQRAHVELAQQVETNAQTRQRLFNESAARSIANEATRQALKELDARVPVAVHVTVSSAHGTRTSEGPHHAMFPTLARLASVRNRITGHVDGIMLSGEQGSGKTTGCKMLAQVMGLDWHFNGAISFPHEMLGFIDGGGTYHSTPFRRAYECGGVYTFDEVDRSDPNALLAVNPHLANGLAVFPDRTIKRHPDCIITATGNTWGFGGDGLYSGATKLDSAFLSRFPRKIAWDIDEQLEAKIVPNRTWLDKVWAARAKARSAMGLKIVVDTRHAIAGNDLIEQQGFSIPEAAQFTFLAGLRAEQRAVMEGVLA